MQTLTMLGTGNAMVTKCYNTCFALENASEYLLVDAGGGNGILAQMLRANISFQDVRTLIITHEHCDHVLGVVWVLRKIATLMKQGSYQGDFHIWCHAALADAVRTLAGLTLQQKFVKLIDERILLHPVEDGTKTQMLGAEITFFDIHSTKALQYGFTAEFGGKKLTCLGDEPYNSLCEPYVQGSTWLLSEAFCLYGEREAFKPYEKHHSTVKEACELAQQLGVPNLVLYHTEDKNYENRKALYTAEGKAYYTGNLFVPNDLERISL